MARPVIITLILAVLPGCAVQMHGRETSGAGGSAFVGSSAVVASTVSSGARVSFVSGQPVAMGAPGGQLTLSSGSAGGVLLVGVLLAEFLNAVGAVSTPAPKPLPAGTRIMHTCSCYGYQPPAAEGPTTRNDER